ncbi:hypothetical protein L596_004578 [Steinernema carpocapsae]|uniref:Exoribonuclease phosphorolytic domain-containing protein n=1 Tax=Steinernema carpocapsae TaxID=34508 RepID=A0A4U8V0D0_STECR|nr:hypothetical protein L596_004578 [Steinernema carpocapsae]
MSNFRQIMEEERDGFTFREIGIHPQAIPNYDGSSLINMGKTRVMCTIRGPKSCELSDNEHNCTGHVYVSVIGMGDKQEAGIVQRGVKNAVYSSLLTSKMYKVKIYADIRVAHDDGNVLAAAINAAVIAITYSGLEMFDLTVGNGVALRSDKTSSVDPTKEDLNASSAMLTVGLMPSLRQFGCFEMAGLSTFRNVFNAVSRCEEDVYDQHFRIRSSLVHKLIEESGVKSIE